MGTKYTTEAITGFDTAPPPDDGTTGDDNEVTWSKHKSKLAQPVVDQVEAIDDKIVAMVDVATKLKSTAYDTIADDNGRAIEVTGTTTITLGAAITMGSGYSVTVKSVSGVTTVATGGSDEIDGSTASRSLAIGVFEKYVVNSSADGYLLEGGFTGIAYSGHVSGGGVGSNMPVGWSVVRDSVGQYTITHPSLPEMNTVFSAGATGATDFYNAGESGNSDTSVSVIVRKWDTGGLTDWGFNFVAVKNV